MLAGNLTAATVHDGPAQKLYVFKFLAEWLVVDKPAGLVLTRHQTWAEALEAAQVILDATIIREACS